jgi:hypothetical protein
LAGGWRHTILEMDSGLQGTSLSIYPPEPGMSGSPILNESGLAVGVVAVGAETVSENEETKYDRAGPQPILLRNLPGWLLAER